jgi:predicted ribosome quality control (RQC) complex YloA/Tae2 family protein
LKDEEIPLLPRIIAVADTFDALTTNRPYQHAHDPKDALRIINNLSGKRLDPTAVAALCDGERPIWQQLAGAVVGLGPVLARETALRAGLDPKMPAYDAAPAVARLTQALRELADIRRGEAFAPVAYEAGGRTVAFAAIPLRVYAVLTPHALPSMSEAVERYYRGLADTGPLEERRRAVAAAVRVAFRQREHALEENRRALDESAGAERYRVMGELLLTYGGRAGAGAASLAVPDHTAGGDVVEIPLDPHLTAVENAQRYFRRYAKAQAAARAVPGRIAQLDAELLSMREALVQIATATSLDDLWEVHTDLVRAGTLRRGPRTKPAAKSGPRRFRGPGGTTIIVGRSARENDHVTFHVAGPDDLWFHARGLAGAHVVLKTGGAPSATQTAAAAGVAAYFSEGREAGHVAVDWVARKHVRKPRGAAPGAVTYSEERTVHVAPGLPEAADARVR